MRKTLLILGLTLLLLVASVGVGYAITYGEPDDGEHPYVGMMLFYDAAYDGWFSCTGSLLDKNTVLTAGHCTVDVGTNLQDLGERRGGTDMWITFDEVVDLSGFPSRADYPDPAVLNPLRFEWLNSQRNFIRGTAWPHPDYNDFAEYPATYDVGIIELSRPAKVKGPYAVLPEVGVLDQYATERGQDEVLFETAGYGTQEVVPFFMAEDARWKATSMLVNLRSNNTDGYNVHTSNNPSEVHGKGGSCFGDSGGPVMFNDTNVVVGIVSFGMNYNCKGADFAYRVDIQDTQDFIAEFYP